MIFCLHGDRFLAVCLLSEIFTYQISIFKEKIVPPNAFFGPNFPSDARGASCLELKQMPQ